MYIPVIFKNASFDLSLFSPQKKKSNRSKNSILKNHGYTQKGIGLPEILIALLLASITLLALMRHYLNSKAQYHHLQTKIEQSIELQLVSELIRDSSRKAGFTPCLGIEHLITRDQRNPKNNLVAIEIGQSEHPSLKMNRMSDDFNRVLQILGEKEILANKNKTLHREQSIIIADCYHAEVQTVSKITTTSDHQIITLTQPLAFSYYSPTYIGGWLEETFIVRAGHFKKNSLYYRAQHAEELTTSVQNLSARLEENQHKRLLRVVLDLDKGHHLELSTMLRIH